ncbi:MAG: hypothetical protein C4293_10770, partial [Nitrospiraceae bacterium]
MKSTTRQRKPARRGCEAAGGRQALIGQLDHLLARGTQGVDACLKGLGRMMAETLRSSEREELAGPDDRPCSSDRKTWASQGGASS